MSFLEALTRPTLVADRKEGEPDLVDIFEKKLSDAGVVFASTWREESEIKEAQGKNAELQRFLIGRNLTFKCHMLDTASTEAARICLNAKGSLEEFVSTFDEHVLPVLTEGFKNKPN